MTSRAKILTAYRIEDGREMRVRAVSEKNKLWLIGINAIGNSVTTISAMKARELAARLRQVGESKLADEISAAAQKAHRANGNV